MDALNAFISSGALFILFVIIVVILCMREVACWYFKINDRQSLHYQEISALQEIIELQKKEIELLEKALAKKDDPE